MAILQTFAAVVALGASAVVAPPAAVDSAEPAPSTFAVVAPGPAQATDPATATSAFVPVTPCRLYDSGTPVAADSVVEIVVVDRCGIHPDAVAVALTVTIDAAAGPGYVTVWPGDEDRPNTSNLNVADRDTRANGAIVALGGSGAVRAATSTAGRLIVDVTGAFEPADSADAGRYVPIEPVRAADTRATDRPSPGTSIEVPLPEGVPTDAIAVAANITTTASVGGGYFTAHAAGTAAPVASVLNTSAAGQTRAAASIVPVTAAGLVVLSSAGDHVIVDVTGYFTGDDATVGDDGLFVAASPVRLADTRADAPPLYPGGSREWTVPLPDSTTADDVAAVAANVTMTDTAAAGWVVAHAARTDIGAVSSVNADAVGQTSANLAIVALSVHGIAAYSDAGTDVVIDVAGYFTGSPTAPAHDAPAPNPEPPPPPALPGCHPTGRSAVADKVAQRYWLCDEGVPVTEALPMTTGSASYGLPPVGTHTVYMKRRDWWGGGFELDRFVGFYRTPRGNNIAFHDVVNQDPATVGDLDKRGSSAGCFRLRRDDSIALWNFLHIGDRVVVIS